MIVVLLLVAVMGLFVISLASSSLGNRRSGPRFPTPPLDRCRNSAGGSRSEGH